MAPIGGAVRAPPDPGRGNLGEQTEARIDTSECLRAAHKFNLSAPFRFPPQCARLKQTEMEPVHQEAAWFGVGDQMSAGWAELATDSQWEPQPEAGKVSRLETRARLTPHFPTELSSIQLCGIGADQPNSLDFKLAPLSLLIAPR